MKNFLNLAIKHKRYSLVAVFLLVAFFSYFGYQKVFVKAEIKYVTQTVMRGNLITSISGIGQVSASSQVDVKPKISSDIISVKVKLGQTVKKNDLLEVA